ncbi:hypothetical protein OCH239_06645 [Roseivivax halodurans JCM 10272]|uniref:Flagellar hook-length control protein-like C-terminal domain-containing protein n=1 Tax=Roseivivax halodurans JCM 10272 TaxID=1449350 RepID=X7EFJ2_9RHOB|nr:flagellar hook-length control protein FliK [Roseivivax halodurans]ETX13868.1 hypothetical protein OCH239_06645 [Roseivivax halodurans JCM 10272]
MNEKPETGRFMIREERFSTAVSGALASGASNGDSGADAIADAVGTDAAAPPDMRIEEIASGAKLAEASRSAQGAQSPTPPLPRQLFEVAGHLRHGAVEVQLAPEELGRVSMKLVANEGGTVLHITADRPETLDLLRRHAGLLYQEFSDAGFGGLDLSFGSSKQDRPDGRAAEHVLHGIAADVLPALETGAQDQRQVPKAMTSSLDIRI